MNTYNVFFEDTFWGYAWADSAWEAVVKVAGQYATDDNGNKDLRWNARLYG